MQDLRTTSGHRISIGYDPAANTLIFREEGWHAEPFRSEEAPAVTRLVRPIGGATVTRLRDVRRRLMRPFGTAA
jgi:hypothetical protein